MLLETLPVDPVAASYSEDEFVEPDDPYEDIFYDNDSERESSTSESYMDVTEGVTEGEDAAVE